MDIHLDTSWCPACAREIMPKRYTVPVASPPPPAPAPPPSSPSSSPTKVQTSDAPPRTTRTKSGNVRTKGGLVHGTGRVKPNGTVKRIDSATAVSAAPAPAPAQPAAPVKQRTVIDQGPIPLYCSDECRMSDLNSIYGVLSADYDPNREATPAVPHNSFTSICETESDSSSGGVSSVDSRSSISWSSSDSSRPCRVSPSIATLAAIYDFPPLPPPPPIIEQADSQSSNSDSEHSFDQYQSGVMMAARRIKAALCPEPVKRSAFNTAPSAPASRDPIPGWTDGSAAWRSSVYSLSNPTTAPQAVGEQWGNNAYKSIVASPHHSRGVQSTVGEASTPTSHHNASTASLPVTRPAASAAVRSVSYADDLYSKYPLSFSRRSESRTSLGIPGSYPTSSSAVSFRQQQEKPLLKPGAEGKLLVPDVKLKVKTSSSLSLSVASSASLSSWRSGSSYPASSRRSIRSPLNRHSSEFSEGALSDQGSKSDDDEPLPAPRRPNVETRSWSYDNLMTYPVMQPPRRREKRIQKQVVNGEERDIEVEVEVTQSFKQLFLFSGKDASL
ncbi:hypothetical protein PILCRDRAFT_2441 [Piloderma croceum F 1598]|uniref:Uncharacterized protein n=1 Tax=Piloderma croceum (strain F 1598) TaxID=765440 RepID=A0A0C3BRP8_PILCF|nr:hypothetical protein PILCRDRAFT_2441 [Piloderma croceum F 1598]